MKLKYAILSSILGFITWVVLGNFYTYSNPDVFYGIISYNISTTILILTLIGIITLFYLILILIYNVFDNLMSKGVKGVKKNG